MKPLEIYSPPGIGDSMWVLQKLINHTNREIHLYTWDRPNVSSPFLLGLEQVTQVKQFKQPFNSYENFRSDCTSKYNDIYIKMVESDIDNYDRPFYLEANDFLENNNHIDTYLPNFETAYKLKWEHDDKNHDEAINLTKDKNTIVIYTSCLQHNNSLLSSMYGQWKFDYWERLLKQIFEKYDGCKVIWVGSSNDSDAGKYLQNIFKDNDFSIQVDRPSTFILPLIRNCRCMITYQSGISCLALVEETPLYMLYFSHLGGLQNSICPLSSINNHFIYKPTFFKDMVNNAKDAVNWIEQHLV